MTSAAPVGSDIEIAWAEAVDKLKRGSSEIVISAETQRIIGREGISIIAQRFGFLINAPTSSLLDSSANVVRVLPPPGFDHHQLSSLVAKSRSAPTTPVSGKIAGHYTPNVDLDEYGTGLLPERLANNSRAKVAKERMTKIPRPPNAFILYRQHYHPVVKAQNPNIHNNQVSIILGIQWKNEDPLVKEDFKRQAATIKQKHHEEHPSYQYQPRKASEKKRRMTKSKATRLASSASPDISMPTTPSSCSSLSNASIEGSLSVGDFRQAIKETVKSIPEFDVSDDGQYLHHNFDASQPGLLSAMADQHNAIHHSNLHVSNTAWQDPTILSCQWTEEVTDELAYDEAQIDWPYINSQLRNPAQAATDADQSLVDMLLSNNHDSNTTEGVMHYEEANEQFYGRHGHLFKEFAPKPRSEWNQRPASDEHQGMTSVDLQTERANILATLEPALSSSDHPTSGAFHDQSSTVIAYNASNNHDDTMSGGTDRSDASHYPLSARDGQFNFEDFLDFDGTAYWSQGSG